jgi:hypothetical protein
MFEVASLYHGWYALVMTKQTATISDDLASDVLNAMHAQWQDWDTSDLTLNYEWHEDGHPVILWESGAPYDWTTCLDDVVLPEGVFCEPYDPCVLVLYPAY